MVGQCSTPNGARFSMGRRWTASPWESWEEVSRPICANLCAGCDCFGLCPAPRLQLLCTVLFVIWSVISGEVETETGLSKAE